VKVFGIVVGVVALLLVVLVHVAAATTCHSSVALVATGSSEWPLMAMAPRLRKFALTVHVISSVGLLGAIAGFLALAVAGLTSQNDQIVRAAYLAMDLIARFVILALALASLLTGLIQSVAPVGLVPALLGPGETAANRLCLHRFGWSRWS